MIAESAVINEYLDEQFPDPALLPDAPKERARACMVVQMTDAYVFARYLPLFATARAEGKESPAVADGIEGVKEGLVAVERVVDDGTYAVGDGLSLADCALAPATRIQANPHVARALADR